jgi:hypothetical protein
MVQWRNCPYRDGTATGANVFDMTKNVGYGRGRIMEHGGRPDTVNIGTMRLERWLLAEIDVLASEERRTRNQQIHRMLEEWLAIVGPEVQKKREAVREARRLLGADAEEQ